MAAGAIMQGSRGGVDLPKDDIDRVKSHLAKYYKKMGEDPRPGNAASQSRPLGGGFVLRHDMFLDQLGGSLFGRDRGLLIFPLGGDL